MIRRIIGISMIACLSALSAIAQGPLTVTEQNVERHGQKVTVTFKVTASDDAVKSGEKIVVTSMLTPAGQPEGKEQAVWQFYVAGDQQKKIMRQKAMLGNGSDAVFIGNGDTYTFVETLPYDTSLNPRSYTLGFSAVRMGCCSVEDCGGGKYSFDIGPAMIPALRAVTPHVAQVRELKPKYPFLRMVGTDAGGERGVSVRFPVAKTVLDPDFLSNSKSLKDIENAIRMVLDDEWAELGSIDIAGYASPEGNTRQNQQLSVGRAEALKAYIMDKFGFSEDRFNVTAGGEDWSGLRALVADSDMPYRNEVLDIIDNVPQEKRQARLKALASGRPYKSMLDVLYPQLRDACYISVWFSEKDDTVAREVNAAVGEINAGRYAEALERLMAHKDDPRTWNAIGSVKVLTEDLKDAQKWFGKAAEAGDPDAAQNLARIEEIMNK